MLFYFSIYFVQYRMQIAFDNETSKLSMSIL